MTGISQIQFAHLIGCSRSWVTQLKKDGRLVLTADGKVDADASRARIAATGGDRLDVAERHAAGRGHVAAPAELPEARRESRGGSAADDKVGSSYQAARAVKEKYAALSAKAEYEKQIGNLIPKEDVDAALRFIGGAVRAAFDVFPDQNAPLVAPVNDLAEVHEILTQSCRDALATIGDAIARQTKALQPENA